MLATGPNGVGKTNLLEALHVGTQGFSPRTRNDRQLIRFGADGARIAARGRRGDAPVDVEVKLEAGAAKHASVNGAPLRSVEQLRAELTTLVFTPDRLGVIKGAPAARRAYFDRALGRTTPARAQLPADYGGAVAQRNASLRRIAVGASTRDAIAPWTQQVVELGTQLVGARREVLALLAPAFAEHAAAFGLDDAELRYDGEPPTVQQLEQRLDRDVERGITGAGPHLDDVLVTPQAVTSGASGRRASSGSPSSRSCWRRRISWPSGAGRHRCSCSTTFSPSSIPAAGARSPSAWPAAARP